MDKVEELLVKGSADWTLEEWMWVDRFLKTGGSSELLEAEIHKGFELMMALRSR